MDKIGWKPKSDVAVDSSEKAFTESFIILCTLNY